jgi:hypothetical protein
MRKNSTKIIQQTICNTESCINTINESRKLYDCTETDSFFKELADGMIDGLTYALLITACEKIIKEIKQ